MEILPLCQMVACVVNLITYRLGPYYHSYCICYHVYTCCLTIFVCYIRGQSQKILIPLSDGCMCLYEHYTSYNNNKVGPVVHLPWFPCGCVSLRRLSSVWLLWFTHQPLSPNSFFFFFLLLTNIQCTTQRLRW
jgi:hypothetical protein